MAIVDMTYIELLKTEQFKNGLDQFDSLLNKRGFYIEFKNSKGLLFEVKKIPIITLGKKG